MWLLAVSSAVYDMQPFDVDPALGVAVVDLGEKHTIMGHLVVDKIESA